MRRWTWMLVLIALALGGCTKHVVRDTVVYQTELNQYDAWATKQAALLRQGMARTEFCTCVEGKFTDKWCADSADFSLTVEARHGWHKEMSLYLAGISEKRPPKDPPEIPASNTLCPVIPEGGE